MVCHAVTVQNQGGENKVGIVLRVGYLLKRFSSNRSMVIQYAKKALPPTQTLAEATLRILLSLSLPPQVWKLVMSSLFVVIFALCISIAVNADLTKSFLLCTGKEELFRSFPTQQFFMIFFSGMTFRISMPLLARLGLSSRDHFGARLEQCTT